LSRGKTITRTEDRSPLRVIGTHIDITDRFDITDHKRAEADQEKFQGQLQQAMKMEAVGRLAGGVAHDFNNLLTVIIGNLPLAGMKLSRFEPALGLLVEANKAAERAAALTQQLLAFSRKQIIEPKVLHPNELIAELHATLVRLIREDIEIDNIPGEDLAAVKIDPVQFQQVLVNLVVNARDAMPDGVNFIGKPYTPSALATESGWNEPAPCGGQEPRARQRYRVLDAS